MLSDPAPIYGPGKSDGCAGPSQSGGIGPAARRWLLFYPLLSLFSGASGVDSCRPRKPAGLRAESCRVGGVSSLVCQRLAIFPHARPGRPPRGDLQPRLTPVTHGGVCFQECSCLCGQVILLGILLKREGPNFITKEGRARVGASPNCETTPPPPCPDARRERPPKRPGLLPPPLRGKSPFVPLGRNGPSGADPHTA